MSGKHEVDVSIIMLTYFHEAYVAQALDSILMQETDLRYEILIGDDASRDRTPEIIREYAARYSDRIRPVLRRENVGANRNFWELLGMTRGKYIAILEGDDYWASPCKLQKQWDYLEENQDCIGCVSKCLIVDMDGHPDFTKSPHFVWSKKIFTLDDLVEGWNLPGQAGTLMCRNVFLDVDPSEYAIIYQAHANVGDKTLMLLLLSRGNIYCSNEILSCYRQVDKKGEHNWFSVHHANPYRNYDMFMYPCRLESWARKNLGLRRHLGKRSEYRFCRFVEELVREPSAKRLRCLADMVIHSHQPVKYSWTILKALIEME